MTGCKEEWLKPRTVFAFMFYVTLIILVIGYSIVVAFWKEANPVITESLKILLGVLVSAVSGSLGYYWGQRSAKLQGERSNE